ncbi:MAG: DUF2798 domain-containing protein [Pseudomonadota bacterium]
MPPFLAPVLFALLLSGMMSFVVSGIATFRAIGLPEDFLALWLSAWAASWMVAFPTAMVVAPLVRRIVAKMVRQPKPD